MNKRHVLLLCIGLIIIVAICVPVFALNGKSSYAQRISGNSVYISLGNIGDVEAGSDISIPVYVGGADYEAHGLTFSITYDTKYFDYISSETVYSQVNNDSAGCSAIVPSKSDVDRIGKVSIGFLCPTGKLDGHGNFLNLNLHVKTSLNGTQTIKISVDEFYSFPVGISIRKDLPIVAFDGSISSGDVYNTITFVDWNGTVLDSQKVLSGTVPMDIPHPHRYGYEFDDWSENLNGLDYNALLVAEYTIKEYTVGFGFVYNGGNDDNWVLDPVEQTVEFGKPAIPPQSPEGYECEFNDDYSFIDKDMTITGFCERIVEPETSGAS